MPSFAEVDEWRNLGLAGHLELNFRRERTCFHIVPPQVLGACHRGRRKKIFLGTNDFIFILGFSFGGVLQFLVSKKVNFDAEKVTNLPIVYYRFAHHCVIGLH